MEVSAIFSSVTTEFQCLRASDETQQTLLRSDASDRERDHVTLLGGD